MADRAVCLTRMEAFVALDVAIGLVFTYLLLSLLCTALNEWLAGLFRLRAKTLKTAVSLTCLAFFGPAEA